MSVESENIDECENLAVATMAGVGPIKAILSICAKITDKVLIKMDSENITVEALRKNNMGKIGVMVVAVIQSHKILRYEYNMDEEEIIAFMVPPSELANSLGDNKSTSVVHVFVPNTVPRCLISRAGTKSGMVASNGGIKVLTEYPGERLKPIMIDYGKNAVAKVTLSFFSEALQRTTKTPNVNYIAFKIYPYGIEIQGHASDQFSNDFIISEPIGDISVTFDELEEEEFSDTFAGLDISDDDEDTHEGTSEIFFLEDTSYSDIIRLEKSRAADFNKINSVCSISATVSFYYVRGYPLKITSDWGNVGYYDIYLESVN